MSLYRLIQTPPAHLNIDAFAVPFLFQLVDVQGQLVFNGTIGDYICRDTDTGEVFGLTASSFTANYTPATLGPSAGVSTVAFQATSFDDAGNPLN